MLPEQRGQQGLFSILRVTVMPLIKCSLQLMLARRSLFIPNVGQAMKFTL